MNFTFNKKKKQKKQLYYKGQMMNLSQFGEEGVIDLFEQSQATQIKIKIEMFPDNESSLFKIQRKRQEDIDCLEDLDLEIKKRTLLKESGFILILSQRRYLENLKVLRISIKNLCIFEGEGILEVANALKHLDKLTEFTINISKKNILQEKTVKQLVDNLSLLKNLESLQLQLPGLRIRPDTDESLNNFWKGLRKLPSITRLFFKVNFSNIGQEALLNLFENIKLSHSELTQFEIELVDNNVEFKWFDRLIDILELHLNLEYLKLQFENAENMSLELKKRFFIFLEKLPRLKEIDITCLLSSWSDFQLLSSSSENNLSLIQSLNLDYKAMSTLPCQQQIGKALNKLINIQSLFLRFPDQHYIVCDEFFEEMNNSFLNMKHLFSLELILKQNLSEQACFQLSQSFERLQNLEKLTLSVFLPWPICVQIYSQYQQLFSAFEHLKNLETLKMNLYSNSFPNYQQILKNIVQLQSLVRLELQQDKEATGINIKVLGEALKLSHSLTFLNINICINDKLSRDEMTAFESVFKSNQSLESLNIQLTFNCLGENLIFGNLKALEKLQIFQLTLNKFTSNLITDLSNSLVYLKSLEAFTFSTQQIISSNQLFRILSSLSYSKHLKRLNLEITSEEQSFQTEEQYMVYLEETVRFAKICNSLSSLIDLQITDSYTGRNKLQFYFSGISKLIHLKFLKIICLTSEVSNDDTMSMIHCFSQTAELSELEISAKFHCSLNDQGLLYLAGGILNLQKLRVLRLNFKNVYHECQGIFFQQSLSRMSSLKIIEITLEKVIQSHNYVLQHVPQFEINHFNSNLEKIKQKKHLLTNLNLNYELKENVESEFLDKQLSFCKDLPYLYDLSLIVSSQKSINFCMKEFTQNVSSFIKLNKLHLEFNKLKLSVKTYQQLSQSFKNLSLLESFYFKQSESTQEYDFYLCEGMVNLINLTKLSMTCSLSVTGIIALGSALEKMQYMLSLELNFENKSIVGVEGATSIGKGLSALKHLRTLIIKLDSTPPIQNVGTIQIAKSLSTLKKLENLNISIGLVQMIGQSGWDNLGLSISGLCLLQELKFVVNYFNHVYSSFIEKIISGQYFTRLKKLNLQIEKFVGVPLITSNLVDLFNKFKSQNEFLTLKFERNSFTLKSGENLSIQFNDFDFSKNIHFLRKFSKQFKYQIQLSSDQQFDLSVQMIESINNVISEIGFMKSRYLNLRMGVNLEKSSISTICQSLPKLKNLEFLQLSIQKILGIETAKYIDISKSLSLISKLKSLKLQIIKPQNFHLENVLTFFNHLAKIPLLNTLLISFKKTEIDKLLTKLAKRKMLRIVQFGQWASNDPF